MFLFNKSCKYLGFASFIIFNLFVITFISSFVPLAILEIKNSSSSGVLFLYLSDKLDKI